MVTRMPTRVFASPNPGRAKAAAVQGDIGIALYQIGRPELAGLGASLLQAVMKTLPRTPSIRAWDFLSITLAIHAADRFVMRSEAEDSWTRMIALDIELAEPEPWVAQAAPLADALRFLSSDIWYLRFRTGGQRPPTIDTRLTDRDCACLFSGGLDSLIGAINLVHEGRRPLLVSQASPKEGPAQSKLAEAIGLSQHRFEARASERWRQPYEPSSRARSMLFVGYGTLAASTIAPSETPGELIVPENGLISINPPLTRRHIGSLSTRTTHPHFIASLQRVLDEVGLTVNIHNPYGGLTKGQMLAASRANNPILNEIAVTSYSCGKGKRLNQHCGRCVPCLIRRASFHAAGLADTTGYWAEDLSEHNFNEDVAAMRFAAASLAQRDVKRWAADAGPLPLDPTRRAVYTEVVRRGMTEVREFLETIWP